MKMKLVGRRFCTGTYNGQNYEHTKLYVVHGDSSLRNLEGQVAEALKVNNTVDLTGINVGDMIDCSFNRYGNVVQVVKL